jgi:broad specificity phosphatase PhoE
MWERELSEVPEVWWSHNKDCDSINAEENDSCRESYREPWSRLQQRAGELVAYLKTEIDSGSHENILLVGHAVLFFAMMGEWLDNCQLVELDMEKLRTPCQCAGHACVC